MHGVARNEHQVSRCDTPGLVAYPKSALTFYDQDEFIVIRLEANDILILFEDIDVARRQTLSVAQKSSLDGITGGLRFLIGVHMGDVIEHRRSARPRNGLPVVLLSLAPTAFRKQSARATVALEQCAGARSWTYTCA